MCILTKLIKFQKTFIYPNVVDNGYEDIYVPVMINETHNLRHITFENSDIDLYCSKCKKQFIQIISLISSFFESLGFKINGRLKIFYIPEHLIGKKHIPIEHATLGPKQINSGLTYNHNIILVYRKEESSKVLIHELIHAYGLDSHVRVPLPTNINIKSSVEIRFTETYTELLSGLIYITILKKNISLKTKYDLLRSHYIKQAEKVLCVYSNEFVQDTHVFEYIIAKAALVKEHPNLKTLSLIYENNQVFSEELIRVLHKQVYGFCELSSLPIL